jgi:hypothetical protein
MRNLLFPLRRRGLMRNLLIISASPSDFRMLMIEGLSFLDKAFSIRRGRGKVEISYCMYSGVKKSWRD